MVSIRSKINLSKNINHIFYTGFLFAFPFSIKISNIFLILLFAYLLLKSAINGFELNKQKLIILLITITYFLWKTFGLVYSSHLKEGLKDVESSLSLILFPILLFVNKENKEIDVNTLINIQIASAVLIFLCAESYIVGNIIKQHQSISLVLSYRYGYFNLASVFNNTPNYLSFFIGLSALYSLYLARKKPINKILYSITYFLCLILIIQLQTRSIIIFVMFSSLLYLIYYQYNKTLLLLITIVAIVFSIIILIPSYNNRYLKKRFFNSFSIENLNKGERRLQRWETTVKLYDKYWLIGTGTGDDSFIRTQNFLNNGLIKSAEKKYNDHNQYLQIITTHGIIGLILFLIPILVLIKYSWEYKYYPPFIFLCLFLFFCITESVLERNKGVVIYSFYLSYFLNYLTALKTGKTNNKISTNKNTN